MLPMKLEGERLLVLIRVWNLDTIFLAGTCSSQQAFTTSRVQMFEYVP